MKNKTKIIIFLIITISVILRVWRLDKVPIALFGDELDVGLQGYSILTTGKDYLGQQFPVMFHSFAEYRYPLQLYLASITTYFFGLNEWGVRIPGAIFGVLSVIGLYFLARELFDEKVALVTAFFLSISPWHLQFSRQANDAGFLLPFLILGTFFFIKGLKNYKYFLLASMCFTLIFYSYATAVLFIPLFVLSLAIIFKKKVFALGFKKLGLAFLVGLVFLLPFLNSYFRGTSSERFSDISVASNDELVNEVVENRKWANTSYARLLYNRYSVLSQKILDNYLESFSATFLFVNGDPNPRQSIQGFGELYHFDVVFVLLGLIFLAKELKASKKKSAVVVVAWLLLAPIPSALTRDGGTHASRLIIMLPALIMIAALGAVYVFDKLKINYKKLLITALLFFALFDISRYFYAYYNVWPNTSWKYWNYGYKEAMMFVDSIDLDYKEVYFNNTYEPALPRFLFWTKYDMKQFQNTFSSDKPIENINSGIVGFKLGEKYYFGKLQKPIEKFVKEGRLFVASAEEDVTNPEFFKSEDIGLIKTVYSPEGNPVFYIFSTN